MVDKRKAFLLYLVLVGVFEVLLTGRLIYSGYHQTMSVWDLMMAFSAIIALFATAAMIRLAAANKHAIRCVYSGVWAVAVVVMHLIVTLIFPYLAPINSIFAGSLIGMLISKTVLFRSVDEKLHAFS
jgi:hypothetical protein